MIQAELKARVRAPDAVVRQLDERAEARFEVYQDTYYDDPAGSLERKDQELRCGCGPCAARTVCGRS